MRYLPILVFFVTAQFSFAQYDRGDACKDLSRIMEMEQHAFEQRTQQTANLFTNNYDIKYHRLEWVVDPSENYISGQVTTYFVPTEDGFDQINFDLAENMLVNAVLYHGDTLSATFSSKDNLQIALPDIIGIGQLDSVTIAYEGAPESRNFGSFEQSTHQGVPLLWTLSEPYGAKTWWPCKQNLTDKIDSIDIYVSTPDAYRVASNGLLMSEKPDGDNMVYHWKHRYPIPAYLIAIAVTNYAVFSDYVILENGDSLEILNYVFPENLAQAQDQLESTVEIMDLFNKLFGDYPFASEKYGHAQFGWGGGMEHQTMSFMGGFSYGLQAHELAHQWFGDKVTCGSWQDIWLNEGFATYLTGLTSEFLGSEIEFYNWKRYTVNSITNRPDGSVWVDDTTSVRRIFNGRLSYNKGAMVLHMLRWTLGDEDFFQAVNNYVHAPELAFHYAHTEDLQYYLEQQSGLDLTEFFNDWYFGEGYPSYQLSWTSQAPGVQIILGQTPSHGSVDFFEMPVPVLLSGQGMDTLVRLEHEFDGQVFDVELPFEVESVVIDPDYWLISANNTVERVAVSTENFQDRDDLVGFHPNPFGDELNILMKGEQVRIDRIMVYNSSGILFREYKIPGVMKINTEDWPEGIYFIGVRSGDSSVAFHKLVKSDQ